MIWSFAGAALGAGLVFGIGMFSKGGLTPVKLALAGTAVGTFLSALSTSIAIHFDVARDVSFGMPEVSPARNGSAFSC